MPPTIASYTAGDVMNTAAALLNDVNKTLFSYATQLPYLRIAQQDLELQLNLHEIQINLISEAAISVTAGVTNLPLPTSFFLPISLMEKTPADDNTKYYSMTEVIDIHELREIATSTLNYWDFRHNCVNLIGSTADRTVRLKYWRVLSAIIDETSEEPIKGAMNTLAFKTAALCALYIGGSQGQARHDALNIEYVRAIDILLSVLVKNNQGNRVRRLPFRIARSILTTPRS